MNHTGCDWRMLATNPQLRLQAARDYARDVMGDEGEVSRWMARSSYRVRHGRCSVASACETAEGFFEAMAELAWMAEFNHRERQKRERLAA